MKIYAVTVDAGDGSHFIEFFDDLELYERLEDEYPEAYAGNEGCPTVLTFPDDLDLKAAGIRVTTAKDVEDKF